MISEDTEVTGGLSKYVRVKKGEQKQEEDGGLV